MNPLSRSASMDVDARGLSCPLPIMRTKKALEAGPAALVVWVDSGTAKANVSAYLEDEGFAVTVVEAPDGWRVEARRP